VKQEKRKYLDYFIQTSRGEEVRDKSELVACFAFLSSTRT
jgi:hypothetical protein